MYIKQPGNTLRFSSTQLKKFVQGSTTTPKTRIYFDKAIKVPFRVKLKHDHEADSDSKLNLVSKVELKIIDCCQMKNKWEYINNN